MNYFLTLNLMKTSLNYEEIRDILENANVGVVSIEGVTEWQDSPIRKESYKNASNALKQHKKDLRF